jgi:Fe-S cluster assembly ATP-binding protein
MITNGKMELCSKNLLEMSAEVRSHEGIFLAFQYPIEISGVTNYDFLRIAYNEKRKYFNQKEVDPIEFMEIIQKLIEKLKISSEFLTRNLNEGFSGGEKKRNEILQMLLLEPKLIILDEIDSGLDVDALKLICDNIKANFSENSSLLIITHYPKILHYLKPDYIHIMREGKIILTGDSDISLKVEEKGFDYFAL